MDRLRLRPLRVHPPLPPIHVGICLPAVRYNRLYL